MSSMIWFTSTVGAELGGSTDCRPDADGCCECPPAVFVGGYALLLGTLETGTGGGDSGAEPDGPAVVLWIIARLLPRVGTTASYTCVVGRTPASCPFDHTGGRSLRGKGAMGSSAARHATRRRLDHQRPPSSRIARSATPAMTGPTMTPTFVFLPRATSASCVGVPVEELLVLLAVELYNHQYLAMH